MEKATDKHSSLNETAGENKNSGTVTRQSKMHEAQGDKIKRKYPLPLLKTHRILIRKTHRPRYF